LYLFRIREPSERQQAFRRTAADAADAKRLQDGSGLPSLELVTGDL
jgi:hypothetical protein